MSRRVEGECGNGADWAPLLEQLAERRAAARAMGGADKLARYRARGASTPAAVSPVCWIRNPSSSWGRSLVIPPFPGRLRRRVRDDRRAPVMVGAEDFTVAAGRSAPRPHPSALEPRSSRCATGRRS
ncbi:hypothetical protein GS491_27020 [Rhodococcus hoagii]|nr:hypothetical protein [Prescottella equi]